MVQTANPSRTFKVEAKDKFLASYPDGQGGQVAYLEDMRQVKAWAYSSAAWLQMHGYITSMTCGEDFIKVEAPGVAPTTYVVEKCKKAVAG